MEMDTCVHSSVLWYALVLEILSRILMIVGTEGLRAVILNMKKKKIMSLVRGLKVVVLRWF